jgi:dephospho-CoA kinase
MKVIGLTGGIGSGKSSIARFLGELGAAVIDADKVGHDILNPGTPGWQEVVEAFGEDVLTRQKTVDRKALAELVFKDPAALEKLNRITHHRILDKVKTRLREYEDAGYKAAVVEAALLIEAGWAPLMDEVWLAIAPKDLTIQRLKKRGLPEAEARARIANQIPGEEKIKLATRIIKNDGSLDDLKTKVKMLWMEIHNN